MRKRFFSSDDCVGSRGGLEDALLSPSFLANHDFEPMKSLLLYLALVGLPVAGLLGILEAGSRLQAPRDVTGEWRMNAPISSSTDSEPAPRTLEISQSGVYLSVTLGDGDPMRGRLRGDTLRVVRLPVGDPARDGCFVAGFLLHGIFDFAAEPDRLVAQALPTGAPWCAPFSFTAVRESTGRRVGGER